MKKRVIVWRITQNCNMNCLFCSYSNEVKRLRNDADYDEVSSLIDVLGKYKQQTNCEILVSWIGGEPFLFKEILPLSKKLMTLGIDVSTTTNGILLSSEKIRKNVIENFSEIVFSLDGFQKCNDRIRKMSGHFDLVVQNITRLNQERKAANSNLKIKINTILLRENIGQFKEFCKLLVKIGVDELTFNQLGGYDRPEFYDDNRLLTEQVDEFIKVLSDIKNDFYNDGLIIHGSKDYLDRIVYSTDNKKISVDECNPGEWFWFINESGFISPCSYTSYEYKASINGIKTFEDIDRLQQYFEHMRKTSRSRWCDDCHCTQLYKKFD